MFPIHPIRLQHAYLIWFSKTRAIFRRIERLATAEVEKKLKMVFPRLAFTSYISDMKLSKIKVYESNSSRANEFVQSFIQRIEWKDYVKEMEVLESIRKEVMEVAKKYQDNYVYVRKNLGEDKKLLK